MNENTYIGARWIKADGTITSVTPANGSNFKLAELQDFVGGQIELIYPRSTAGAILVLNEEGKFLGLPPNPLATRLLGDAGGALDDIVVGDVLLCLNNQIV